jgi:hypothetical protein
MPATPSASAEKMSGTTSMRRDLRKLWPAGCVMLPTHQSSAAVPSP